MRYAARTVVIGIFVLSVGVSIAAEFGFDHENMNRVQVTVIGLICGYVGYLLDRILRRYE